MKPGNSPTKNTSFPKDQIRIVLVENVHPRAAEVFADAGYRVDRVGHALEAQQLIESGADLHVLGVRSKTSLPAPVLNAMPKLLAAGIA